MDEERPAAVLINLAAVTFCDSSGIAVLDEQYGIAADRGIALRIVNTQPPVARVLQIVGLLDPLTRP